MTLANDQLDHIYMTERLRAELAAANEFKKHYTDLISVNAELMGAPNDGSITDSVVQIEKLVKKLRADLDAANEEVEKLRERLGPHGLVVVDIDKTGHYVSEKVADEITRLRTDLAVANERCEMLTKEVVEWRSRPDALRADKAEADLDAAISDRNGHYATLDHDQTDAIVIASLKEAYRLNADPLPDEGGEKWVDVEFLAAIDHVLEYYHNYEQKKLWIVEKESFNNGKSNK